MEFIAELYWTWFRQLFVYMDYTSGGINMGGNNNQNLRVPTPEQAREYGRKGGLASAKKYRERKAMKETLEALLNMSVEDSKDKPADLEEIQSIAKLKGANISAQEAIMFAQMRKAMKGDTRAAEFIRDTIGQKPTDVAMVNVHKNPLADLSTDELRQLIDDD